ncbi:MAG: hypothetical protein JJE29_06160 [Peptostreptococcaceae bacterium]|nr:hypothetical protein [Peptostreptococcaceae bacterium]
MTNYIVRFKSMSDLKKYTKILRKEKGVKGRMQVVSDRKEYDREKENYVSGVMLGKYNEVSALHIAYAKSGMIIGAIVGGVSSLMAVYLGLNSVSLTTIPVVVSLVIVFYGATVGSLIGLMIGNMFKHREESSYNGEYTLFISDVEENKRDVIVQNAEKNNSYEIKEYGLTF